MKLFLLLLSCLAPILAMDEVQQLFLDEDDVDAAMGNATVNGALQLLSYTNLNGSISGIPGGTCVNPISQACNYIFSTIVQGSPVVSIISNTLTPKNGVVDLTSGTAWNMPAKGNFMKKPTSITVLVAQTGNVFVNGQLTSAGYHAADMFSVDTTSPNFVPFNNQYTPWPSYTTISATSSQGNTLVMKVSMQCAMAGRFGPNCMMVNCVPIGNQFGSCQDLSGNTYVCQVAPTVPDQFTNCNQCPSGKVSPSGTCTPNTQTTTVSPPPNPPTKAPLNQTNLVSASFQKATIALAIILVIVVIIGVGVIVKFYMNNKKSEDPEHADFNEKRKAWAAHNAHSSASSTTGSETSTGTSRSGSTTSRSTTHNDKGFRAIPDTPDRDHLGKRQFANGSSASSRRSSKVSADPAGVEMQSAHSSLPDGRTTPRLEAHV